MRYKIAASFTINTFLDLLAKGSIRYIGMISDIDCANDTPIELKIINQEISR